METLWGLLGVVYMTFGKHMGTLEGRLYDVWDVYGDPMGSYGTVYMMFGECMWTLEVIGALILGLGRVLGP